MVNTYTSGLEEKLRQAEDAADEVSRLESLASQAPLLRAEVARAQRQEERDANRMGMLDLVRLEGLGGFKVLVQEKGTGITDADRLSPASDRELPLPLLGPDHLALMEARYPHAAWDPEDLWPWGQGRPGT